MTAKTPVTADEIELALASLQGEITIKQFQEALTAIGRTVTYHTARHALLRARMWGWAEQINNSRYRVIDREHRRVELAQEERAKELAAELGGHASGKTVVLSVEVAQALAEKVR